MCEPGDRLKWRELISWIGERAAAQSKVEMVASPDSGVGSPTAIGGSMIEEWTLEREAETVREVFQNVPVPDAANKPFVTTTTPAESVTNAAKPQSVASSTAAPAIGGTLPSQDPSKEATSATALAPPKSNAVTTDSRRVSAAGSGANVESLAQKAGVAPTSAPTTKPTESPTTPPANPREDAMAPRVAVVTARSVSDDMEMTSDEEDYERVPVSARASSVPSEETSEGGDARVRPEHTTEKKAEIVPPASHGSVDTDSAGGAAVAAPTQSEKKKDAIDAAMQSFLEAETLETLLASFQHVKTEADMQV